jgi:hypothetical protein
MHPLAVLRLLRGLCYLYSISFPVHHANPGNFHSAADPVRAFVATVQGESIMLLNRNHTDLLSPECPPAQPQPLNLSPTPRAHSAPTRVPRPVPTMRRRRRASSARPHRVPTSTMASCGHVPFLGYNVTDCSGLGLTSVPAPFAGNVQFMCVCLYAPVCVCV